MKTLVIYYSLTGATKMVADLIAERLNCKSIEILEKENRKGIKEFLSGGKDAMFKKYSQIKLSEQADISSFDTVIVGTPVWAFTMTPAVRSFLMFNKKKLKNTAFFCTLGGRGGQEKHLRVWKNYQD
ncbi:hypothetical protein B9J78_03155 [bacterium Unc6]|nr:hypothetical protein [bacterium Unc6]